MSELSSLFVDQSENAAATIGSNYLQNFLINGKVEKGVGILTQKRFYYKGKNYSGSGKAVKSASQEGIVSLDDITYTEFTYIRSTGMLIAAVICTIIFPLILAAAFFYIRYFIDRQTIFIVYFPGGEFAFDIRYYPIADIQDFQRQLHLLKDNKKMAE